MDLLKAFKQKKESEESELRHALYIEGIAAQLKTSMKRANEILEGNSDITMEEFQNILDSHNPHAPLRFEQFGVKTFSRHHSGLLESVALKSGGILVQKFGLENEQRLVESHNKVAHRTKFTPESTKPVKIFKNKYNTVQYAVFTEKQRFVVSRWTSEEDVVRDVDKYPFEGAADSLEGKAALAKALKSAETRFILDK